jgi:hypothetical protein
MARTICCSANLYRIEGQTSKSQTRMFHLVQVWVVEDPVHVVAFGALCCAQPCAAEAHWQPSV